MPNMICATDKTPYLNSSSRLVRILHDPKTPTQSPYKQF